MFTPLNKDNALLFVNAVGCVKVVPAEPSRSIIQVVLFASRTDTWYVPAATVVNTLDVCQVVPLIEYSKEPEPPVAELIVIEPFVLALHKVTFTADTVAEIIVGWVIAVPAEPSRSITQDVFAASRIDIWYVPAVNPVNEPDDCQVVPLILY